MRAVKSRLELTRGTTKEQGWSTAAFMHSRKQLVEQCVKYDAELDEPIV